MKKHIIKMVLFGLIIFFAAQHIFAQAEELKNADPKQTAKVLTEWMKNNLSLDSTAVTKVYNINLKYAKKNKEVMSSSGGKLKKLKEFKANGEAKDKELKSIFTDDQYKIYQQKKEEMRDLMKERIKEKRNSQ